MTKYIIKHDIPIVLGVHKFFKGDEVPADKLEGKALGDFQHFLSLGFIEAIEFVESTESREVNEVKETIENSESEEPVEVREDVEITEPTESVTTNKRKRK